MFEKVSQNYQNITHPLLISSLFLYQGLRGDIRTVDEQLKFLKNAVEAIEKNRGNYSYIKDGELANRKKFVEQSTNNVQSELSFPLIIFLRLL